MQVKLLRAIQERQFERVGGRRTVTVDVRLVAATNRDMEAAVRNGTFRLDLYHRLSVVNVFLPPLRERPDDIGLLAQHFLAELCREHGRDLEFSPAALDLLVLQRWPGNVRELRNAVERAVISAAGPLVGAGDLDLGEGDPLAAANEDVFPASEGAPPDERGRVRAALERSGFVQAKAARLLGMTVRQLAYRVRKYGIELERF
jgi:Nif-specific regulatory protein